MVKGLTPLPSYMMTPLTNAISPFLLADPDKFLAAAGAQVLAVAAATADARHRRRRAAHTLVAD